MENAEVPVTELSLEEKERSISAAKETLNASLSLLQSELVHNLVKKSNVLAIYLIVKLLLMFQNYLVHWHFNRLVILLYVGKETPWLASTDRMYESAEPVFLELHATAMLCLPSGECLCPDATVCTTLTSALYSSAGDEVVLNRQLMVCFFNHWQLKPANILLFREPFIPVWMLKPTNMLLFLEPFISKEKLHALPLYFLGIFKCVMSPYNLKTNVCFKNSRKYLRANHLIQRFSWVQKLNLLNMSLIDEWCTLQW